MGRAAKANLPVVDPVMLEVEAEQCGVLEKAGVETVFELTVEISLIGDVMVRK